MSILNPDSGGSTCVAGVVGWPGEACRAGVGAGAVDSGKAVSPGRVGGACAGVGTAGTVGGGLVRPVSRRSADGAGAVGSSAVGAAAGFWTAAGGGATTPWSEGRVTTRTAPITSAVMMSPPATSHGQSGRRAAVLERSGGAGAARARSKAGRPD